MKITVRVHVNDICTNMPTAGMPIVHLFELLEKVKYTQDAHKM